MHYLTSILLSLALAGGSPAADLNLSGQSGLTYENRTYDCLMITDCRNITIRNCIFSSSDTQGPVSMTDADSIVLEGCDIDGNVNACNGVSMSGCSYVTVRDCDVHDVADDGFQIFSSDNIDLTGNTVRHLYGCGTDGGCGPCYNGHSDGIELYDSRLVNIHGNLVYDVRSTSALIIGSWDDNDCYDLTVTDNIFYTPECAMVAYIFDVSRIKVFNNIMWMSSWQGVAIGRDTYGLEMKNNILQNINFTHMVSDGRGMEYDPDEHDIDYNLLGMINQGCPYNEHDILMPSHGFSVIPNVYSSDTYRDVTAEDFMPLATNQSIDAGCTGADVPATDFFGTPRDASPDMGAIEYVSTDAIERTVHDAVSRKASEVRAEPNPFTTYVNLTVPPSWRGDGITVRIYDRSGNGIRTLGAADGETGPAWFGNDRNGRRVPGGTYYADIRCGDRYYIRSLVLLPE